jgi:IclR family transcriptional regulator, acetate operon repressor
MVVASKARSRRGRPSKPTKSTSPRSVARLVQIFDTLCSRPTGASLAALSESMGIPKSSLLNLLRGLLESQHLTFVDGLYQLGPEAFGMAGAILATRRFLGFAELARPVMRRLVDSTRETSTLAVMSSDRKSAVYVEKFESPTAIRFSATVGDSRPLLWSSVGRVLLAFQVDHWLNEYMRTVKMVAHTPQTEMNRKRLRDILEEVRRTHVAVTINQGTMGVAGFAAPIFDSSGLIVAAIGLAAPAERAKVRASELSAVVRDAGIEISRLMGYRPFIEPPRPRARRSVVAAD